MSTPQIAEWEFIKMSGAAPWIPQSRDPVRFVKAWVMDRTLHVRGAEPIPLPLLEKLLRLNGTDPSAV